jgi:MFS family permease
MLRLLYNRAFGSALGDNAWYITVDVFWATIFAGAYSFAGAYAIRLGASNQEVSLLSALTALTAAIVLLPAGRFLQQSRRPTRWILSGLMLFRVGTLAFVLMPWLPTGSFSQGTIFVIYYTLLTFPMHFFNLGFIPLLAEAIPEAQRADAFTARNVVQGGAMALSTFLLGLWLGRVPYPANYQSMFFFGFVVAMISLYYLGKVKVPDSKRPAPRPTPAGAPRRSPFRRGAEFFAAPFRVQGFARIFVNSCLFSVGLWAATPLFLLYPVRTLGATEGWLGAYGAVGNVALIAGNLFWRRVIYRWGEPKVLRYVVLGMGFYPLLVGATPSLTLILVLAGLNGLITAGFNLSHFTTFLKVIPESERHNFTAFYLSLANVGAFVSPLLAVAIGESLGFGPVLIVCGFLVCLTSLSFWLWPVGPAHWVEMQPLQPEEGQAH